MLNLLETLLSNSINDAGGEGINFLGEGDGIESESEFSQFFNELADLDIDFEQVEKLLPHFMSEDGGLDIEQLKIHLKQYGQNFANQAAMTDAVKQETFNAEMGMGVTGELQQVAQSHVTETAKELASTDSEMSSIKIEEKKSFDANFSNNNAATNKQASSTPNQLDKMSESQEDIAQQEPIEIDDSLEGEQSLEWQAKHAVKGDTSQGVLNKVFVPSQVSETSVTSNHQMIDTQSFLNQRVGINMVDKPALQAHSMDVQTPIDSADWPEQFNEKIVWLTNQTIKSASIKVNPQELGPIDIHVKMLNDQASVQFTSHNVQIKEVIEQAIPKLRDMMEQQGVSLGDVNVSSNSANTGQNKQYQADNLQASSNYQQQTQALVTPLIQAKPQGLIDYFA